MITRYRIKMGTDPVLNLAEREAFKLDGVDYPADWITRGGTIPGHTIQSYDATPPPRRHRHRRQSRAPRGHR